MFEQTTSTPTLLADKAYEPTSSEERAAVLYNPIVVPGAVEAFGNGEQTAEAAAEWGRVAGDIGLDQNDLNVIANVRSELSLYPPTPERTETMRRETHEHLARMYGPAGANEALLAARALIAKTPALKDLVNKTGMGDDLRVVVRFARLAMNKKRG